jgi:hypothetical protein
MTAKNTGMKQTMGASDLIHLANKVHEKEKAIRNCVSNSQCNVKRIAFWDAVRKKQAPIMERIQELRTKIRTNNKANARNVNVNKQQAKKDELDKEINKLFVDIKNYYQRNENQNRYCCDSMHALAVRQRGLRVCLDNHRIHGESMQLPCEQELEVFA